jgi:uncharacterized membrane protein
VNRVSCRGERLFVPIGLGESTAYVIAILAAFALRAFRLGYQELRGDEAFGYFFSLQSGADILRNTLALREPHPVAGYFVAKAWMALVGDSEFALRFVSLWWGVLAVALLYRLACCLGLSRVAAFVAAALAVLSPYAIWHSQDGRMYAMSLALSLGSTWLALKALRRERWRYWAGYVLVSWLALHTHYYTIFVLVAQNAFVLGQAALVPAERVVLKRWLAAQLALGLLYLPWLIAAHATLTGYVGNGDSPGLASMLQRALATLVVGESLPSPVGDLRLHTRGWVSLLIDALVVLGAGRLIVSGSRGRRAAGLLGLYLVVPLAALWLSAQSRPIFNERYLIVAAPPCYLLLAAAARPNPPGPPSLAGKGGEVLPSPCGGGAGGEVSPFGEPGTTP